jgi:2-polyprenyl-6-methoxyphenol hydroxylase-like FAD-dependent oxidoreductase
LITLTSIYEEIEMDTDVLIVGAGPTGLMLANQLGRRGVRTLIIDRHSGPAQQSRAMAVHARTLEIYAKLGIADRAVALGARGTGANMWAGGERKARVPFGDMGAGLSPYPFVLTLGQDDNELIMGENLGKYGLVVQWDTELTALTQQADGVTATLEDSTGASRTLEARYVAGCDGGRSAVRELNGIGFPGAPYQHVFFVADTEAQGPMIPSELNIYLWRDGFHLFFPMRGQDRWRVIGILPPEFRDRDDLKFEEIVASIKREAGAALSFKSCDWFSTYRIQHRCTERFRRGRCFLLGDAAHVHSPMGGQGMNTGLQDAYNLAWKLALVIDGRANDSLLESYEIERMQVAHRLLSTTDRAFRMLVADNFLATVFRTRVVARIAAAAMKRAAARRIAFLTLSMIGISYPQSPLSRAVAKLPRKAPRPGDRFPWAHLAFDAHGAREDLFARLDDTRFNLVVVGQGVPTGIGRSADDLLRVHVAADTADNARELERLGIEGPAFYLLRPDGHVGLAGTELDVAAIESWFAELGVELGGARTRRPVGAPPASAARDRDQGPGARRATSGSFYFAASVPVASRASSACLRLAPHR